MEYDIGVVNEEVRDVTGARAFRARFVLVEDNADVLIAKTIFAAVENPSCSGVAAPRVYRFENTFEGWGRRKHSGRPIVSEPDEQSSGSTGLQECDKKTAGNNIIGAKNPSV